MNIADNPVFQDADKAREFLESLLWGDEPICPHCGLVGCSNQFHGTGGTKGTKHRAGVYKCKGCEKQYTVTVGTVFERSHIPLNKWLLILHLMVCSKKGVSAHQIHRMLGLTYKTAWFACHRIREAMRDGRLGPLGGENKVVEIDETYIGGKEGNKHAWKRTPGSQGGANKAPVLSLIERDGMVRSQHVANVNSKTLGSPKRSRSWRSTLPSITRQGTASNRASQGSPALLGKSLGFSCLERDFLLGFFGPTNPPIGQAFPADAFCGFD